MNPALPAGLLFTCTALVAAAYGQNAAPSSHMVYDDANFAGDILVNEVRVPKDGEAKYTYYEALGWSGKGAGYAGIQAHPRAHNYIFSIWDHKEHTAPIRAVYQGPGTLTENFGGEGTGLKSWNFELGWDTDAWYTLVTRCWPVGEHTYYGFWVRSAKTEKWTHLMTMDVAAKEAFLLGGNDSFIEDWLETGKNARTTHLRNGWKRNRKGEWHAFGRARYSVNSWDLTKGMRSFNFRTNWNGGVMRDAGGEFYFMTAGGRETRPTMTNPSLHTIERNEKKPAHPAIEIRSGTRMVGEGVVEVSWENDPTTLPQFGFTITAHDNAARRGTPVASHHRIEPQARSARVAVPRGLDPNVLYWHVQCQDVFGNDSKACLLSVR